MTVSTCATDGENRVDSVDKLFEIFCKATSFKSIVLTFRQICTLLEINPVDHSCFYRNIRSQLISWQAQQLWARLDRKFSLSVYSKAPEDCSKLRVLVIGAGPCGLRFAIEAALLGCRVIVVEKRDSFSRNNVLHLWPYLIKDLHALGAKHFYPRFCAGSIDHISIRQLQCMLLKVALLLGVEVHAGVTFVALKEPAVLENGICTGWGADILPVNHPIGGYEFDVLIGADGRRNTIPGFPRQEFRGKLAIAITANFINYHTAEERDVPEISGVAYIFNQEFFKRLREEHGIDLENIVYYKDDTHYFVMTAKKNSLLAKKVLRADYADVASLLDRENIDDEALMEYAKEAANFCTEYSLPKLDYAVNQFCQPDVAMFDFTCRYAAESACRYMERCGRGLLVGLVGDSLLEPFWPMGTGCARGFFSAFDAAWLVRQFMSSKNTLLESIAERETIYQMLSQTTPENINKDFDLYTLDPSTRYMLKVKAYTPQQVVGLIDSDTNAALNHALMGEVFDLLIPTDMATLSRRNRYNTLVEQGFLAQWARQRLEVFRSRLKALQSDDNLNKFLMTPLAMSCLLNTLSFPIDVDSLFRLVGERADAALPQALQGNMYMQALSVLLQVMRASKSFEDAYLDKLQLCADQAKSSSVYLDSTLVLDLLHRLHKYSIGMRLAHAKRQVIANKQAAAAVTPVKKSRHGRRSSDGKKRRPSGDTRHSTTATNHLQAAPSPSTPKHHHSHRSRPVSTPVACQPIVLQGLMKIRQDELTRRLTESSGKKNGCSALEVSSGLTRQRQQELVTAFNASSRAPAGCTPAVDIPEGIRLIKSNELQASGGRPSAFEQELLLQKNEEMRNIKRQGLATDRKETFDNYESVRSRFKDVDERLNFAGKLLGTGNIGNLRNDADSRGERVKQLSQQIASPSKAERPPSRRFFDEQITAVKDAFGDHCYFCRHTMLPMDTITLNDIFFHKQCFVCDYCDVGLLKQQYEFYSDPATGRGKFYCLQHFDPKRKQPIIPKSRPALVRSLLLEPRSPPRSLNAFAVTGPVVADTTDSCQELKTTIAVVEAVHSPLAASQDETPGLDFRLRARSYSITSIASIAPPERVDYAGGDRHCLEISEERMAEINMSQSCLLDSSSSSSSSDEEEPPLANKLKPRIRRSDSDDEQFSDDSCSNSESDSDSESTLSGGGSSTVEETDPEEASLKSHSDHDESESIDKREEVVLPKQPEVNGYDHSEADAVKETVENGFDSSDATQLKEKVETVLSKGPQLVSRDSPCSTSGDEGVESHHARSLSEVVSAEGTEQDDIVLARRSLPAFDKPTPFAPGRRFIQHARGSFFAQPPEPLRLDPKKMFGASSEPATPIVSQPPASADSISTTIPAYPEPQRSSLPSTVIQPSAPRPPAPSSSVDERPISFPSLVGFIDEESTSVIDTFYNRLQECEVKFVKPGNTDNQDNVIPLANLSEDDADETMEGERAETIDTTDQSKVQGKAESSESTPTASSSVPAETEAECASEAGTSPSGGDMRSLYEKAKERAKQRAEQRSRQAFGAYPKAPPPPGQTRSQPATPAAANATSKVALRPYSLVESPSPPALSVNGQSSASVAHLQRSLSADKVVLNNQQPSSPPAPPANPVKRTPSDLKPASSGGSLFNRITSKLKRTESTSPTKRRLFFQRKPKKSPRSESVSVVEKPKEQVTLERSSSTAGALTNGNSEEYNNLDRRSLKRAQAAQKQEDNLRLFRAQEVQRQLGEIDTVKSALYDAAVINALDQDTVQRDRDIINHYENLLIVLRSLLDLDDKCNRLSGTLGETDPDPMLRNLCVEQQRLRQLLRDNAFDDRVEARTQQVLHRHGAQYSVAIRHALAASVGVYESAA